MNSSIDFVNPAPELCWIEKPSWSIRQQQRIDYVRRQLAEAGEHDGYTVVAESITRDKVLHAFPAWYSEALALKNTSLDLLGVVNASLVLLDPTRRKVLLSRRALGLAGAGLWEIGGGHLDPYESPLQAALRETQEELGLDLSAVKDPKLLGWRALREQGVWFIYSGQIAPDTHLSPNRSEVMQTKWFSLDHLPPLWRDGFSQVLTHLLASAD